MNEWMDGWMDGWIGGWMNEWILTSRWLVVGVQNLSTASIVRPSWGWLTPAVSHGRSRLCRPCARAGTNRSNPLLRWKTGPHGVHGPHGFLMFLEAVTAAAGALAVQTLVVYVVSVGGFEEKRSLLRVGWCELVSSGVHSWWVQRDLVKQQQCETFSSTVQTAQGCASTRVYWSWIWLSWGP